MTDSGRVCYRCEVERPIEMFYVDIERRRSAREGRKTWNSPCRICQREINEARKRPRQDYVDAIKLERGCTDCGIKSEHPEIYDFDHLPGVEKVASVASLLTKGTMEDLVTEIAKCEVVCANCHRIRTRSREAVTFGRSWSAGR